MKTSHISVGVLAIVALTLLGASTREADASPYHRLLGVSRQLECQIHELDAALYRDIRHEPEFRGLTVITEHMLLFANKAREEILCGEHLIRAEANLRIVEAKRRHVEVLMDVIDRRLRRGCHRDGRCHVTDTGLIRGILCSMKDTLCLLQDGVKALRCGHHGCHRERGVIHAPVHHPPVAEPPIHHPRVGHQPRRDHHRGHDGGVDWGVAMHHGRPSFFIGSHGIGLRFGF
jgi:hypothetical protein